MRPLVEIPLIVQHDAPWFASVFSAEAFVQFQRYVSGLIVSEKNTVEGINRLFVIEMRHQSRLHRWLTESALSVEALNRTRLQLLSHLAGTQMKRKGVLSLDDPRLVHSGQHFEKIAYLYDAAQGRYVWAHHLVNLHYSDDQTEYPVDVPRWEPVELEALEAGLKSAGIPIRASKYPLKERDPQKWRHDLLRLWRRHQQHPAGQQLYQSKLLLAQQILTRFVKESPHLRLPVTCANWDTQPAFCRLLDQMLHLPSVGTFAADDQVVLNTGTQTLEAVDVPRQREHQPARQHGRPPLFHTITRPFNGDQETYYRDCQTHRSHHVGTQRVVINHRQEDLSDAAKFLVSHTLNWPAPGITRIRRHRWPVVVSYEEGKAEGLDQ